MAGRDIIRIYPERIHSWHIDRNDPDGRARNVKAEPHLSSEASQADRQ